MTSSRAETVTILAPTGTRLWGREIAVDAPVAIEVNGLGYAVMMMTPAALTEFATGFMLTERLADTAADLHDIDLPETPAGIIVRVTLAERCPGRKVVRASCRASVCQSVYIWVVASSLKNNPNNQEKH